MQQSIDHALDGARAESEGLLRATAEFVLPKWPQLRAEITKVKYAATVVQLLLLLLLMLLLLVGIVMLFKVLSAQLSSEEKKLQIKRLKELRKQIKDAELDIFLAGQLQLLQQRVYFGTALRKLIAAAAVPPL